MNFPCTVPYPWALLIFSWLTTMCALGLTFRAHRESMRLLLLLEVLNRHLKRHERKDATTRGVDAGS